MVTNIKKLRGAMVEHELNVEKAARLLDIDKSTLYRKLAENGDTFTVREARELISAMKLSATDAIAIFFADDVAHNATAKN